MGINSEIINDLEAPIKSFRIMALERAIREGCSHELLNVLRDRSRSEEDEECTILLNHAIPIVQQRLSQSKDEMSPIQTPEEFERKFNSFSSKEKLEALYKIESPLKEVLAAKALELLKTENELAVSTAIIRIFGIYWPKNEIGSLREKLFASSLSVRLAALDILVRIAPEELIQDLPALLTSEDPGLRALAVQWLTSVDLEEALAHLKIMLVSPDSSVRQAGIRTALFLPFEKVKTLLLNFISVENDTELLGKALHLFQINADVEAPYRLWEIAESAISSKSRIVKDALAGACNVIKSSQILGEKFQEYLVGLQNWVKKRQAVKLVLICISKIENGDDALNNEITALAVQKIRIPSVREAFVEALEWPLAPHVSDRIRSWLGLEKVPEVAPPTVSPEDELLRQMAGWEKEDQDTARKILSNCLAASQTPLDLVAACIRVALRLEIADFKEDCRKFLNNSNSSLVSAAIEYLGRYDLDWFSPFLGRYLNHQNLRLKTSAIQVLRETDPAQTVSFLMAMLKGKHPELRETALTCMVHVDFSLLRDNLTDFLLANFSTALLKSILCLFQANPEPENLFCIYRLERALSSPDLDLAGETRKRTTELLVKFGRMSSSQIKELEGSFPGRFEELQKKKAAPIKPYSVQKLQKEPSEGILVVITNLYNFLIYNNKFATGFIIFILSLSLCLTWLLAPEAPSEKRRQNFPLGIIPLSGVIETINGKTGEFVVLNAEKARYLLPVKDLGHRKIAVGNIFSGNVFAISTAKEGFTIARIESITKPEK